MITPEKQFNQGDWYQAIRPTALSGEASAAIGELAVFVEESGSELLILVNGSEYRISREVLLSNFLKVENGEAILNQQINELIASGQKIAADIKNEEGEFSKIQNAFQLKSAEDLKISAEELQSEAVITLRKDLIVRKMGEEIARKRNALTARANQISEIHSFNLPKRN